MNKVDLSKRIEWWTWWVVVGDALWLPVETWMAKNIKEKFGWVTEYLPVSNNWFLKKTIDSWVKLPFDTEESGIISDDSIFTMAGMRSISEKRKIDIQNLFDRHKKLFDKYGDYWFGWITRERFKVYNGDVTTLSNVSWWNGVMMKWFPYAVYFHAMGNKITDEYVDNMVVDITKVTHNSLISKLTALVHNKFMMILLKSDIDNLDLWKELQNIYEYAIWCEDRLSHNINKKDGDDSNMKISPIIQKLIKQYESIKNGNIYTYEKILKEYIVELDDKLAPGINKTHKPWFHVWSTFGLVYACFIQNQNFQWLLDAINIWYDTDSQASIVGSMVWALRWPFYEDRFVEWISSEYRDEIRKCIQDYQNTISNLSNI